MVQCSHLTTKPERLPWHSRILFPGLQTIRNLRLDPWDSRGICRFFRYPPLPETQYPSGGPKDLQNKALTPELANRRLHSFYVIPVAPLSRLQLFLSVLFSTALFCNPCRIAHDVALRLYSVGLFMLLSLRWPPPPPGVPLARRHACRSGPRRYSQVLCRLLQRPARRRVHPFFFCVNNIALSYIWSQHTVRKSLEELSRLSFRRQGSGLR